MNPQNERITQVPHSLEAETACLGAILLDNEIAAEVFTRLDPGDFYNSRNKIIAEVVRETVYVNSKPIDLITLQARLRELSRLEDAGGVEYINSMIDAVPTTANIEQYADIIRDKALLRRIIAAGRDIALTGNDQTLTGKDALDKAEQIVSQLDQNLYQNYFSFQQVLEVTIDKIADNFSKRGQPVGIPSGFTELDKVISGFQPAHLIVIGARPGMGKTTFALSILENIAIRSSDPVSVGFFSLEMNRDQLCERILCAESKIKFQMIQNNHLMADDLVKIRRKMIEISNAQIFLDDAPGLSLYEINAKARRMKKDHGVNVIFVDYLQMINQTSSSIPREQFVASLSRGFKQLARELEITVIALAQLNRGTEGRSGQDKRPQLSDIRESGAIEQDADMVMFLHRPSYYEKDPQEQEKKVHEAKLIIAKNRHGITKTIQLHFAGEYARFENVMNQTERS